MFKINNKETRIRNVNDKIKNKDTVDVFIVNFEHISLLVTVFPLLTLIS